MIKTIVKFATFMMALAKDQEDLTQKLLGLALA